MVYKGSRQEEIDNAIAECEAAFREYNYDKAEHETRNDKERYEQVVSLLNPEWQPCPYCGQLHPVNSEC